jgi:hypothetical protein
MDKSTLVNPNNICNITITKIFHKFLRVRIDNREGPVTLTAIVYKKGW